MRREEGVGGIEHVSGLTDILGRDLVGDVHQLRVGGDAENHAFHRPHVAVGRAEVGRERDKRYLPHGGYSTGKW